MEKIAPENLSIYKFEPNNILMIHRTTKDLYQYFQTPILAPKQTNLYHEHLLQAYFLPTGVIYKKGITTMNVEIIKRIKSSNKQFYEEEELVNTFLPILLCLHYLHSKNIVHGSVSPQNIIFDQEGNVLLRDWLIEIPKNKYYEAQKQIDRTQNDDIFALGQILLQSSSLVELKRQNNSISNSENLLRKIITKYSRGFILGINIMLKKVEKFYPHLQKIFKNNQNYIDSSQTLISMYKKLQGQKYSTPLINAMLNQTNFKYLDLICKTPLTVKKAPKVEDSQNKKTTEEAKKKNIERVSKIAQKTLNNQIFKKSDMALKKMSNMKLSSCYQHQKSLKKTPKEDALKFGSPTKGFKTISRKKAF